MMRASKAPDAIRDADHFGLWEPVNEPQMRRDAQTRTPVDVIILRAATAALTLAAIVVAVLLALLP